MGKDDFSRRRFLYGFGTTIALPMLEYMIPTTALAQQAFNPVRVGFIHQPLGYFITMGPWNAKSKIYGTTKEKYHPIDVQLKGSTAGYAEGVMFPQRIYDIWQNSPVFSKISSIGGFKNTLGGTTTHFLNSTKKNGISLGHDHNHFNMFSCTRPKMETYTVNGVQKERMIGLSKTIDVAIAEEFHNNPNASLTYILNKFRRHLGGASDILRINPSTIDENRVVESAVDLREMFNSLFSGGVAKPVENNQAEVERLNRKKSVVDYVLEDVKSFQRNLSSADKIRLEEYLDGVDQVSKKNDEELVVAKKDNPAIGVVENQVCSSYKLDGSRADGSSRARIDLFHEMMVKSFQCNRKPIMRFMYGDTRQRGTFADGFKGKTLSRDTQAPVNGYVGGTEWHDCSHNTLGPYNNQQINGWVYEKFMKVAESMDQIKEANGKTLLDNSLLVITTDIVATGGHYERNHCVGLAGSLGGRLKTGVHKAIGHEIRGKVDGRLTWASDSKLGENKSFGNLWLTILKALKSKRSKFGDSTGYISDLIA